MKSTLPPPTVSDGKFKQKVQLEGPPTSYFGNPQQRRLQEPDELVRLMQSSGPKEFSALLQHPYYY